MALDLPPFGNFPGVYRRLADPNDVMTDWPDGLASFQTWREERRNEIAEAIWPYFDKEKNIWVGAARDTAQALSYAEIDIMHEEFNARDILNQAPKNSNGLKTHRHHFTFEDLPFDDDYPLGENFGDYEPLSPPALAEFKQKFRGAFREKAFGLFWLKGQFVRPRPNQVAMLKGDHDFKVEVARTGLHSSIYSGHCVEGILLTCGYVEHLLDEGRDFRSMADELGQYMVDFGDRRVFAGVHYPSDNLASWALAAHLIPKIFRHSDQIMPFVGNAIRNQSLVHEVVVEHYTEDPLRKAFKLFEDAWAGV